jgi:branched-chain amino acid transport system substrate-binding protein
VIGKLSYDQKGDVLDPKYVVYIWKDGKYTSYYE